MGSLGLKYFWAVEFLELAKSKTNMSRCQVHVSHFNNIRRYISTIILWPRTSEHISYINFSHRRSFRIYQFNYLKYQQFGIYFEKMTDLPTKKLLKVGCVGGGQLGRMMALEAPRLNIAMSFLDPLGDSSPAALAINSVIKGDLHDEEKLQQLAVGMDVVTIEIEHVGVDGLEKLEKNGVNIQPSSRVIRIIQDKFVQKVRSFSS